MNSLSKYVWLVETIHRAGRISLEDINDRWRTSRLSDGEELPRRTFFKWRCAIEKLFDINIVNEKGGSYRYYIENAGEIEKKGVKSWLVETIGTSNLLMENISLRERIIVEDAPSGREFLAAIIGAMKDSRVIAFTYHNYWRADYRTHELEPYFVKMFRQRWYVVGRSLTHDAVRVFCLDRMSELKVTERKFHYPADFSPEAYFADSFGVIGGSDSEVQPEHIRLKVAAAQANYIRDLPFKEGHQTEVERTAEYSIFDIYLRPTYDVVQEILWNGPAVEVLAPQPLRRSVAEMTERMEQIYKSNER